MSLDRNHENPLHSRNRCIAPVGERPQVYLEYTPCELCAQFPLQSQLDALEKRPNSLPDSIDKVSAAPEFHICKYVINLRIEMAPELIRVAIGEDTILSAAIEEVEIILKKISVLWTALLDQKLNDAVRQQNLNALAGLVSNANALDNQIASMLDRLDAAEASIIDQSLGSLITLDGLNCECACDLTKRSVKHVKETAAQLLTCINEECEELVKLLKATSAKLQKAIDVGVRDVKSLRFLFSRY